MPTKPKPQRPSSIKNGTERLRAAQEALANNPRLVDAALMLAEPAAERMIFPGDVVSVLNPYFTGPDEGPLENEHLVVVGLDRRRRPVEIGVLTTGSEAFCIVDPKQIFRWALTRAKPVSAIILAHNHPSGDPTPSPQDHDVTRRVALAGRTLDIPVLDHIVWASAAAWTSLAREGALAPWWL